MHLNLLYSQAALLTYFRLTNAASIPKKHLCCVSQYSTHVRYELLMGPLDPVSLGYKIQCAECQQFLFFHGLPPIQPFYSESHAYTKFSTLAFSQGFFSDNQPSHTVEPHVSRSGFKDTILPLNLT